MRVARYLTSARDNKGKERERKREDRILVGGREDTLVLIWEKVHECNFAFQFSRDHRDDRHAAFDFLENPCCVIKKI